MTNKKGGVTPVGAGLAGAAIGAAVGAAAVALSDDKTRKNITKKLNEFKEKGQKAYSDIEEKVEEVSSGADKKVQKAKKTLKGKL